MNEIIRTSPIFTVEKMVDVHIYSLNDRAQI
jgi:hypothetical protein